jgi:hypothetical protein
MPINRQVNILVKDDGTPKHEKRKFPGQAINCKSLHCSSYRSNSESDIAANEIPYDYPQTGFLLNEESAATWIIASQTSH